MVDPVHFVTDGSSASLAVLAAARAYADRLGAAFSVLHFADRPDATEAAVERAAASAQVRQGQDVSNGTVAFYAPQAGIGVLLGDTGLAARLLGGILPLLALPAGSQLGAVQRILFPADLSAKSNAVFDVAIGLARSFDAELHLLHVFGPDRAPLAERNSALRATAQNPGDLWRIDQGTLLGMQDRAIGLSSVVATAEGRAHSEIVRYAADAEIDLVVMAHHGRRSIEDAVLGSTTDRVIGRTNSPVLAIRA